MYPEQEAGSTVALQPAVANPDQSSDAGHLVRASIHDFKAMMKFIAKHDLWDELEHELSTSGVEQIHISAAPVRSIASAVRRKAAIGHLPVLPPDITACACVKKSASSGGSDAGHDAGACSGDVMPEGSSCS